MQPNDNDDDDDSYLNTVVDNCCSSNYATLNLDDDEIQKYFVNISSNFSRTSSIRRSVRNFSSSSKSNSNTNAANTPTHSTRFGSVSARRSLRTTPSTTQPSSLGASGARQSPFFFDQFSNTVACLNPSIPTYYSDVSSCSSKASTLSRNRSNTGSYASDSGTDQQGNFDPIRLRKALTSTIDNVAYYHAGQSSGAADKQGNPPRSAGYETSSSIRWNFLGDLKKEEAEAVMRSRRRRSDQQRPTISSMVPAPPGVTRSYEEYWRMRKSTQNVNTVSIWCAENDERNAIMFHHESGVVENCSSNDLFQFINSTGPTGSAPKAKSSEVLNNTLETPSKLSGSLQNMQRNVFSQSSSNIYNISSDFKVFEKQSNLPRNSINLSQNYLSSMTSSQSSLDGFSFNNPNLNLNKVLNTSQSNRVRTRQRESEDTGSRGNNMALNITTLEFEKPSHLINLTAQNQLYQNSVNENYSTSTEMELNSFDDAHFSITSTSTEIIK